MAFCASPLFQCIRSDAPPAEISRCCNCLSQDSASCATRPGILFRAVKLLPMNRTLIGDGGERLVIFLLQPFNSDSFDSAYRVVNLRVHQYSFGGVQHASVQSVGGSRMRGVNDLAYSHA